MLLVMLNCLSCYVRCVVNVVILIKVSSKDSFEVFVVSIDNVSNVIVFVLKFISYFFEL